MSHYVFFHAKWLRILGWWLPSPMSCWDWGIDGWNHGFKGLRCFVDTKLVSSNHMFHFNQIKSPRNLCRAGNDFRADEALDWLWVQPLDTWCIPKLLEDQTSKCSKRTNRDAKNTIVNLSISSKKNETINQISITWQFFVPFWGWLSDLQLGNQKVTLNHLERGVPTFNSI